MFYLYVWTYRGQVGLYALKFTQFAREISLKRITVFNPRENERKCKFGCSISGQAGVDFVSILPN